jgi:hypothetical protein
MAGPAPLKGTCNIETPASLATHSPVRCCKLPTPAEEKLILPGCALARASKSGRDLMGESCATLETQGINLSDFDMMIAAHAVALNITLVSRDKAFAQVHGDRFRLEIW